MSGLRRPDDRSVEPAVGRRRCVRVERADCLVLVQDLGRAGYAHLGVPGSGALDPESLALANRLVGNEPSAAGLEVLLGGLTLVPESSVRVSLAGGPLLLRIDGRAAPGAVAVSVPAGARIDVQPAFGGLRAWLAIAGGVDAPLVLGSRSRDTLSGLGPDPLHTGDVLELGVPGPVAPDHGGVVAMRAQTGGTTVSVGLGPHADWFDEASVRRLTSAPYRVLPDSDRIALRLHGAPLLRTRRFEEVELPSEGMVTGAVQVPGDGQPVVLMADHPTTGGYPVVGVVDADSLARCAQLRPGDTVRFI